MPSVTLLPTPEPEKMPIRWPWPQVSRPSIARTPVDSGASIRGRSTAGGGARSSGTRSASTRLRPAVDALGRGRRSRGPAAPCPTRSSAQRAHQPHAVAAPHAGHVAQRIDQRQLVAKADHLGRQRLAGLARSFDQRAPPARESRPRPPSCRRPTTPPFQGRRHHRRKLAAKSIIGRRHTPCAVSAAVSLREPCISGAPTYAAKACPRRRALYDQGQLLFDPRSCAFDLLVDPSVLRLHDTAALRHAGIGDQLGRRGTAPVPATAPRPGPAPDDRRDESARERLAAGGQLEGLTDVAWPGSGDRAQLAANNARRSPRPSGMPGTPTRRSSRLASLSIARTACSKAGRRVWSR